MNSGLKNILKYDDYIKIRLMKCHQHGYSCLNMEDQRISEGKCCGSWDHVKTFDVSVDLLEKLLKQHKETYHEVENNDENI